MNLSIVAGLLIPFLGTTAGAACVFFLKKQIGGNIQRIFTGFAAGVMVAASVWSLLIPAMDMCEEMGKLAFLPAVIGFLIGIVFLLFIDSMVPHLHVGSDAPEGHKSSLNRTAMLMLAVTIHNFPEGAACGAIFAGVLNGDGTVTMAGALTLAIGIAIQNFPEGAIISLPLRRKVLCLRRIVGSSGTGGSNPGHCTGKHCDTYFTLYAGFCSRSHDLCGRGGTDSGSQ